MLTHRIHTNRIRVNYIFLLCIFSLDFLYNNIFNVVLTRDVLLVLFLILVFCGFFIFGKTNSKLLLFENKKYVYWTWGLVLVSSFIPLFNGIQGYFETLLAQRSLLAMSYLLLMLKMAPSEEEILLVFKRLTIITIFLGLISIFWPYLFMDEIHVNTYEAQMIKGGTDLINTDIGVMVLTIYYFYLCQDVIKDGSLKNVMKSLFLLSYLIIFQNRSTLLVAVPLFVYTVLKMRSKYKAKILLFLGLVGVVFFYYVALNIFDSLINETQTQLASEGYNRWQAMDFFFFERQYGVLDILLGHSVPAAGSSYLKSLVEASEDRWAFISDIGTLGVFFYYGLLFLLILYIPFVIKVLCNKKYPIYLKVFALWILIVPTYHGYNLPGSTKFVIYYIFMYLVIIYKRDVDMLKYNIYIRNTHC